VVYETPLYAEEKYVVVALDSEGCPVKVAVTDLKADAERLGDELIRSEAEVRAVYIGRLKTVFTK
jgi:hypothetical protein